MTLVVATVGANLALEHIVNKTAPENLIVKLFKSNTTPAITDTAATYTEAVFPGYAAITLTGATWAAASARSIAYAQQTWTASGVSVDDIYGYYIVGAVSGTLYWAERDASAPFAVRVAGDAVKITPALTA
jgi:hypothetical protein